MASYLKVRHHVVAIVTAVTSGVLLSDYLTKSMTLLAPVKLEAKEEYRGRTKGFVYRSWREYELSEMKQLTPTTKRLRFLFPDKDMEAGIRAVSCILGRCEEQPGSGVYLKSPFYPVSRNSDRGYFDVVVKRRVGDTLSSFLTDLKPGERAQFKCPLITFPYRGGQFQNVGIVAGGTGILPMMQLLQEIVANPLDTAKVSVIYAASSKKEILFQAQLKEWQRMHPTRFRVQYVTGPALLTTEVLRDNLPPPGGPSSMVFVSGPDAMMEQVCGTFGVDKKGWPDPGAVKGLLAELGYRRQHVWKM